MNSYNNQCKKECGYQQEERRWPIGMTYVPMQKWRELYPLDEGFRNGTIFKELNLPFYGRREC